MMMLQVIVAAMIFNKQGADPGEGRAENDAESALRQCKVQLHGQMEELVNGLISSKSIQAWCSVESLRAADEGLEKVD